MARTTRMNIMVDAKIKHAMQVYADQMGLTLSALCAYVLGDFVRREEAILAPMMQQANDALMQHLKVALSAESEASLDVEVDNPLD